MRHNSQAYLASTDIPKTSLEYCCCKHVLYRRLYPIYITFIPPPIPDIGGYEIILIEMFAVQAKQFIPLILPTQ